MASVGYSFYSAWRADAAYQEKLTRLRELGVATRIEDLPADETDPRLQAAIDKLASVPGGDQYARQILGWAESEGPDNAIRAKQALASVIPAVLEASKSSGVGFNSLSFTESDPKLQEMKSLMGVATGEAKLAALEGNYRRSIEAMDALIRLARLSSKGSGYLPYLIGNIGFNYHQSAVQLYITRFENDEHALLSLTKHLEALPDGFEFSSNYKSQLVVTLELLRHVSNSDQMQANLELNGIQYSYQDRAKEFAKDSSFVKSKARHRIASAWIDAAETMKERKEDHTLYADLRKLESWNDGSITGELVDQCIFIPASGGLAMQLEQIARKRVLLAAAKVTLERKRTGEFPKVLSGGESHTDPFTGKPLLYRPTKEGFLLYSVGVDLMDGGGQRSGPGGRDIVFEFR